MYLSVCAICKTVCLSISGFLLSPNTTIGNRLYLWFSQFIDKKESPYCK